MAKPSPQPFTVTSTLQLSPNIRRVTLAGDAIQKYPDNAEGGYIKLVFPNAQGDKPLLRTYTIARFDKARSEMDIDFVVHESSGPASRFGEKAQAGDTINIAGPGPAKPLAPDADWFLIAGDMTAIPAIRANLKALPKDTRGYLILEVLTEADKDALDIPENLLPAQLEIKWLINPHPGTNKHFSDSIRTLKWQEGKPAIWIAGELNEVLRARTHLKIMPNIDKVRMYISSYWQHGMTEDRHKTEKQRFF